ncbi:hypothetical protein CDL15_Pgr000663 [Punica granatum]|uniref:Uncharacterized protein n=1 Tax=Punica granatum TaxID=22663 RepID=A0A218W4P8_PUNGR|nr:hypothetical protein CDL15_Pgr000663 [Punica granatum]
MARFGDARAVVMMFVALAYVTRIMAAEELDIAPVAAMETGAGHYLPLPGVSACCLVLLSSIFPILFR